MGHEITSAEYPNITGIQQTPDGTGRDIKETHRPLVVRGVSRRRQRSVPGPPGGAAATRRYLWADAGLLEVCHWCVYWMACATSLARDVLVSFETRYSAMSIPALTPDEVM